jgi:tetratricopeptide (TPR) repeat protein
MKTLSLKEAQALSRYSDVIKKTIGEKTKSAYDITVSDTVYSLAVLMAEHNIEQDENRYVLSKLISEYRKNEVIDIEMDFELHKIMDENKEWSTQFSILMEYQNNGMEYEKTGDVSHAIQSYELCVKNGESLSQMRINNYLHSIERLAILYRKTKQYDKEVDIIKLALKHNLHTNDRVRFENRLSKTKHEK